jgi:hypothetical protein
MSTAVNPPAAGPLHTRSRRAHDYELRGIPWLATLADEEREEAIDDLRVVSVEPGEYVCRIGRPVTYWFGVVEGLLKMSNDSELGVPITLEREVFQILAYQLGSKREMMVQRLLCPADHQVVATMQVF